VQGSDCRAQRDPRHCIPHTSPTHWTHTLPMHSPHGHAAGGGASHHLGGGLGGHHRSLCGNLAAGVAQAGADGARRVVVGHGALQWEVAEAE
jgi:hypothetical protein